MIDVGFKNFIDSDRILFITTPSSSKVRWLVKDAIAGRRLINCTQGKKVSSIIILNTDHIVLSSMKCLNLKNKLEEIKKNKIKNN